MKIKLPIKLKNPFNNKKIYIYDHKSINIDLYRDDCLTLGICFNQQQEDIIVEKISAVVAIMSMDYSSKLTPVRIAKTINEILGLNNLEVDLEGLKAQCISILKSSNKVIRVQANDINHMINRIKLHTYDPMQKLLFELSTYMPEEHYAFISGVLKGTIDVETVLCQD